jgi:hypothetical protein
MVLQKDDASKHLLRRIRRANGVPGRWGRMLRISIAAGNVGPGK